MEKRRGRIVELCKTPEVQNIFNEAPFVTSNYRLFNRSRICGCQVPKAASTSLGRTLLMAEYPENADRFSKIPGYQIHVQHEIRHTTRDECFKNSMTSYFVTRNPYTRLYSAYIDKIYMDKFNSLSVSLHAMLNKNISKMDLVTLEQNKDRQFLEMFCHPTEVTFAQFLNYIVTTKTLDMHFGPASFVCNPCEGDFNIILKQQHVNEELHYLFDNIYKTSKFIYKPPPLENYVGESGVKNLIMSYYTFKKNVMHKYNCTLDESQFDSINKRFWNALKILGSIDEDFEFIDDLFRGPIGETLTIRPPETILYEFKANNVHYLEPEQREKQRHKYLIRAYREVDRAVISKIQQLYQLDFSFFEYNPVPPQ